MCLGSDGTLQGCVTLIDSCTRRAVIKGRLNAESPRPDA